MDDQAASASKEPSSAKERAARPVGRPPLLDEEGLQVLMELTLAEPQATIRRLQERMAQEFGKRPSRGVVRQAARLLGLNKEQPRRQPRERRSIGPAPVRGTYRYRAHHRREPSRNPRCYPSDLTNAEWARIEPFVVGPAPTGRPRLHPRRTILNAIFYVLRTGCQWRMLPLDYPPWQTVYSCFRRWKQRGTIKKIHDCLRDSYRQEQGREVQPSAGIIDSQSVKTAEKGGPEGTTRARRSRAASAISSSTRWG